MIRFISIFLMLFYTQISFANSYEMKDVLVTQSGPFSTIALPIGFNAVTLDVLNSSPANVSAAIPKMSLDLEQILNQLEQKEKLNWMDYVTSSPWDFVECPEVSDDSDYEEECYLANQTELDEVAMNPEDYVASDSVIELQYFHTVYKDSELIGFVYEYRNHIDEKLIEDGSGFVIYLDSDMKVLRVDQWKS